MAKTKIIEIDNLSKYIRHINKLDNVSYYRGEGDSFPSRQSSALRPYEFRWNSAEPYPFMKMIEEFYNETAHKLNEDKIDFIAYNNGYVIVGQIKFANSGRTRYDIWKARQSITKAVSQMRFSLSKFSQDKNLLFSILKKYDFCKKREDIKRVVPVVITSSSYFIGEYTQTKIPVVSWDMFSQIIKSLRYYDTLSDIEGYFSNLDNLYNFGLKNEITVSEIECEDFYIQYEEYDWQIID